MGSSSSKGKKQEDTSRYGQIYLKTDKTAYYAGETVTGTIFLNLISHYPGNQLFLKFKGKETVHILESQTRDDSTEYVHYSDKNQITKQSLLVHRWDDNLPPGQFVIPFSFLVPQNLPPSFYQQGPLYLAFVEYKLEAYLQPFNDSDPKMKHKQPWNLKETILPNSGDLLSSVTTQLKTCCCCQQGSNSLKAEFEKNFYYPGENARVNMELNNSQTTLNNNKVIFSLKQKLELKVAGRVIKRELVKVQQEVPTLFKDSQTNAESLTITLPRFPTENDFKRNVDHKSPSIVGALQGFRENKDVITSTTKSSLITSTFFLEVSCPMSGCCANTPKVQCPIGICSPDFQLPVVTAPQGWQPYTMNQINLAFPPNSNYMNGPFVNNPNQNMVEAKMFGNYAPNNQANLEVTQAYSPNYPHSNHNQV